MDSRYDTYAAHRAYVGRHVHECRSDECPFCEAIAEDRAREREAS